MSDELLPVLAVAVGVYLWVEHKRRHEGDQIVDVPVRRRVYDNHDYARYANDSTVRKARSVDRSLYGASDREERVLSGYPTDTIPIDPVGDPFWRNRRRGRMIISRDEREAVPLVQSRYQQPFAMSDDSDLRADELRKLVTDRVSQHQELRWDNVAPAPRAAEWAPDPNTMLQSVAFKQHRRLLGDTSRDFSFRTRTPTAEFDESAMTPPQRLAASGANRRQDVDVRNVNSKLPATTAIQA